MSQIIQIVILSEKPYEINLTNSNFKFLDNHGSKTTFPNCKVDNAVIEKDKLFNIWVYSYGESSEDIRIQAIKSLAVARKISGIIINKNNVKSPDQLKNLINYFQEGLPSPLVIAIDGEGGKINRLTPEKGFLKFPSAKEISLLSEEEAINLYESIADQYVGLGINYVLGPVLDINVLPEERSYSEDVSVIVRYSKLFIKVMKSKGLKTCLKHLSEDTLEPYKILIQENLVDMIMLSQNAVFSSDLKLKLQELNFSGPIITDDLHPVHIQRFFLGFSQYDILISGAKQAILNGANILIYTWIQLSKDDFDDIPTKLLNGIEF